VGVAVADIGKRLGRAKNNEAAILEELMVETYDYFQTGKAPYKLNKILRKYVLQRVMK